MNIELTTSPTPEDAKTISQGLVNFNRAAVKELGPPEDELKFSIFARDDDGTVVGGLRAVCFWNTLHVELLWLEESIRGQGLGSSMLQKAEDYAREKCYGLALLESTDWQAKEFYEKQGYDVMGSLDDYPRGHTTHFLTKKLLEGDN